MAKTDADNKQNQPGSLTAAETREQNGKSARNNKRKADSSKDHDDDEVVFLYSKKQKTELDFHKDRMNNELGRALGYAEQGNRTLMEYSIDRATEHAQKAGQDKDIAITQRLEKIRQVLTKSKEEGFHRLKCKAHLVEATGHAEAGNRSLMEYALDKAKENAKCLGDATHQSFEIRANNIRKLINTGKEMQLHRQKLEYELERAMIYAKEGNRSLMEYALGQASDHAKVIPNLLDPKFLERQQSIRESLGDELSFHVRKLESDLRDAKKYAEDGNRSLMEYCFRNAKEHAEKAGRFDDVFHTRVTKIEKLLVAAPLPASVVVKGENASKTTMAARSSTDGDAPPAIHQTMNEHRVDGEDDVLYEKRISVNERIELSLKEAEASGKVIDLAD